jgi:hypothetical protein
MWQAFVFMGDDIEEPMTSLSTWIIVKAGDPS